MLQADQKGVTIEYIPTYGPLERVAGGRYVRYDISGTHPVGVPGEPGLSIREVLVRFPGVSGNRLEIVSSEYTDEHAVLLAPVPRLRKADIGLVASFDIDAKAYSKPGFSPATLARIGAIGETRGVFLGSVILSPLQYDPAGRTLRKYTRIVVRVNFGPPEAPAVRPDPMARGLALNDQVPSGEAPARIPEGKTAFHNSVLAPGALLYRFTVKDDGMYRLTGTELLSSGVPAATDPGTIRIYSNGGTDLPQDPNAPSADDLIENAVYVNDGGTAGKLDASDYLVFYGKGTRGWTYDGPAKTFRHYVNHYAEGTPYWVICGTGSSKRMASAASLNQANPYRPARVTGKLFQKDDRVNILSSGLEWVGQSFFSGDRMAYVHSLPGLDASRPVLYKIRVASRSKEAANFEIDEHTTLIASVWMDATDVDSYEEAQLKYPDPDVTVVSMTPDFTDGESQLIFRYTTGDQAGNGYFDYCEIFYQRFLRAQNDMFSFHAPDTAAVAEFSVSGFSGGQMRVFDVTRPDSVIALTGARLALDTCSFQVQLSGGSARELFVAGESGYRDPGTLTPARNQNLHGDTTAADLIIVTHPDFMSAALRLKQFRESPAAGALRTTIVDVTEIYNEFGGGIASPVAIRNYLRYVYRNSPASPRYALLFGSGNFDYKQITKVGANFVPAWETGESLIPVGSYASDDDFCAFTTPHRVDMGIGRLTARTLQEATTMVDKIIEYENAPVNDPWKARVTLVADDDYTVGTEPEGVYQHLSQADNLAEQYVPQLFEKRKIYLAEYSTVITSSGRRKPAVNLAIRDQINLGTLVLNFTGHGNPSVWSYCYVFVRETDFPELRNKGKYFFLVAATCNYSAFDQAADESSGEMLVSMSDAGAIAVFAATRPVYAFNNFVLNQILYQSLFQQSPRGAIVQERLGDVVYGAKQSLWKDDNSRKYFLLGDPALRLNFPKLAAAIDSVNHTPNDQIVQLPALGRASLAATVRDTAFSPDTAFSGTAQVVVYDADQTVQLYDPKIGSTTYKVAGNVLFRGEQTVAGGRTKANFIVPKDISYTNNLGRVTLYCWNSATDGIGYTTNIRIGGTDSSAPRHTKGPDIRLYLDSRSFRSGDVVSSAPRLLADLQDDAGINTSGAGIGHRLEAWLDAGPESIDLTGYYKSKLDTYQEGTVDYPLGELAPGTHTLKMRAWDTYDNPSTAQMMFDVVTGAGLKVTNVFNYPNPFSSRTVFTFEHNQIASVDAELKVYTVAGRMIQSLKVTGINQQQVRIPWDGRDRDGDILANGVYLYKVIVRTEDGRLSSEAYGKLSVLK